MKKIKVVRLENSFIGQDVPKFQKLVGQIAEVIEEYENGCVEAYFKNGDVWCIDPRDYLVVQNG